MPSSCLLMFSWQIWDSNLTDNFKIHCKYIGCTQYSFWQCYVSHCNLAVRGAANDCAQPMAVLNLRYSYKKYLLGNFVVSCTNIWPFQLMSMTVLCRNFDNPIYSFQHTIHTDNFFIFSVRILQIVQLFIVIAALLFNYVLLFWQHILQLSIPIGTNICFLSK